jgi:hypothetical protein
MTDIITKVEKWLKKLTGKKVYVAADNRKLLVPASAYPESNLVVFSTFFLQRAPEKLIYELVKHEAGHIVTGGKHTKEFREWCAKHNADPASIMRVPEFMKKEISRRKKLRSGK